MVLGHTSDVNAACLSGDITVLFLGSNNITVKNVGNHCMENGQIVCGSNV